jgi:6-pyruvoyltetrahydropterin/6-carboxytetrahydropterin synthase
MHKLARQVWFSISPFLSPENERHNESLFKRDEGLSIFFELAVELVGNVEPATGFIVNVTDIDEKVHKYVVPIFTTHISETFQKGKNIGTREIINLLKSAWEQLADKFGSAKLHQLTLALNPYRKVFVDSEDCKMIYHSEKFEFAATHKLWNNSFSPDRNFEVFGNCANPAGHGHNYVVEVTVKIPTEHNFYAGAFAQTVENEFLKLVDHKNLNVDVSYFKKVIPTVENIAAFAWEILAGKFGQATLHCVTVWETDRTYCSYYG